MLTNHALPTFEERIARARANRLQWLLEQLSPSQQALLNIQVATIREEILIYGESTANCVKLLVLCPDVAISGQWGEIAKIAITEQWSFSFFPNGDVRFANL